MKKNFAEPLFTKTIDEMKEFIVAELEHNINMSFKWCYHLSTVLYFELEVWGSPTPYERLGEIIFELEHRIELLPEEERPERWMYQPAIDEAMKRLNAPKPKFTASYPFTITGDNLVTTLDKSWKK